MVPSIAKTWLLVLLAFLLMGQDYGTAPHVGGISNAGAGSMQSVWSSMTTGTVGATPVTRYISPQGFFTQNSSIDVIQMKVPHAGFINGMSIRLTSDIGTSGDDMTITLLIDGVDTDILCTIEGEDAGTQDFCTIDGEEVAIAVGDLLQVRYITIGSVETAVRVALNFAVTMSGQNTSILMGNFTAPTSVRHCNLYGDWDTCIGLSNFDQRASVMSAPGNFTTLTIELDDALTLGTREFHLTNEGVIHTASSCLIDSGVASPGDKECTTTGFTMAVVPGDKIGIRGDLTASANASDVFTGATFVATNASEFMIPATNINLTADSDTEFQPLGSIGSIWASSGTNYLNIPKAFTATELWAWMVNTPGGSATRLWTLRKNAGDTALNCTFDSADNDCNDDGESISFNGTTDTWTISNNPDGTPANSARNMWTITGTVP